MMMTEMDIETSVYYVHLTRLIAREDYIKFTRRESTKTDNEDVLQRYIFKLNETAEQYKATQDTRTVKTSK